MLGGHGQAIGSEDGLDDAFRGLRRGTDFLDGMGYLMHFGTVEGGKRPDVDRGIGMRGHKDCRVNGFYVVERGKVLGYVVDESHAILLQYRRTTDAIRKKDRIVGGADSHHVEEVAGQGNKLQL